jgi:hypothetical protein
VEQDLWDEVQARLTEVRAASGADDPDRPRYWESRRAHHVLTGKAFCGCCGGAMTNIGRDYLACSAARRQGMCGNRRGIRRGALEKLILDALRTRLMQPEHVATFNAEFTAEWNRLQACPATSGTDPLATLGIDPSGCVSLFGWWDRFSVPTWFPCGVARSCGQAWPQATGVAGREACLTATSTTPGSGWSG